MDVSDSDDEELPTNLDLTIPLETRDLTASTARSSTLTDRTVSQALPPSPRTARKRTHEEVYQRPQIPRASTTPLRTPPKRMSQFERIGFNALPAESQTTVVASQAQTQTQTQTPTEQTEQREQTKTFVQDVQAYQEQLEKEFKQFETSLSERNKKEPLEDLDWEDLERRYQADIGPNEADEQAIIEELQTRFQARQCLHEEVSELTRS